MRLIDADALDRKIYNDVPISVFGSVKKMAAVRELIDDAHTIDAVPVVRCGECKYCYAEGFVREHNVCEKHPEINDIPDGWFCADGERRES